MKYHPNPYIVDWLSGWLVKWLYIWIYPIFAK